MSSWRVTINGTFLGQNVANIIGVRGAGDVPAGAQGAAVAARVREVWNFYLLPSLSNAYTTTSVDAVSMTNPEVGEVSTGTQSGGQTVPPYTGAVCAAVDIRTGFRGRSFRGRTGLCGLVEADVEGNNLTETRRADLESRFADFFANLAVPATGTTETYELGVISRVSNGVKRTTPIFTPATTTAVRARLGTRVMRLR